MDWQDLEALRNEYVASRDRKVSAQHAIWSPILGEYCLDYPSTFGHLIDGITRNAIEMARIELAMTPRLHTTVRKMSRLMSIQNPEFQISSQNAWNGPIAAILDNHFGDIIEGMGWEPEQKKKTLWAALTGTGVTKVGLSSEHVYGETAYAERAPKARAWADLGREQFFPRGVTTEYTRATVRPGDPVIVHVPTTDIFFNLGARRWKDVRRIYHRDWRPLVDVVHDARYAKAARAEVWGTMVGQKHNEAYLSQPYGVYVDDTLYVEVVECFDKASRQYCVFVPHCRAALRDWTPFPLPIESPYEFFQPIPHPEYIWAIPYALTLLGSAQATNYLRQILALKIGRDGKTVNLVPPETSDEVVKAMNEAYDGEFVKTDAKWQDGKAPFQTVAFGQPQAEILTLSNIIGADFAETSGLTDPARNTLPSSRETATAVQTRAQEQGITVDDFLRENEADQARTARKVLKILLSEWPQEKMIKVTGPVPEIWFWVKLERQRLIDDTFALKVVAGSSERMDRATVRAQWNDALAKLGTIAQWLAQDEQRRMQGLPPGPINWMAVAQMTLDLYNPTWKHKVLSNADYGQLIVDLATQHQLVPANISPQLLQQLADLLSDPSELDPRRVQQAEAIRQLPVPNGMGTPVGMGGQGNPAAAGALSQGGEQAYGAMGGEVTGRALSEAAA